MCTNGTRIKLIKTRRIPAFVVTNKAAIKKNN